MTSSWKLGRIAGVEIALHWSWLLVVAILVWSLSQSVFPSTNPGLANATYIAMAVVAAIGFFASILLHELGHAIQARRDGVAIDGITLWVFGGVASLRGQPRTAGAELRIAAAGPVVSLVLGVVSVAVALLLRLPSSVDAVVFWLGYMNLSLLIFNLLPALPLDGGRILRALLWARRRDFVSATRTAGRLGRGIGQLLIAGGVALALFAGDLGGLWLAFIGWFVLAAAEAELQQATARDALAGLTAADLAIADPVSVPADASLQAFINQVFMRTRHTAYPVIESGRPVGIVSFRHALGVDRQDWPTTSVRDVMVSGPEVWIGAATPLADALAQLGEGEVKRALVHDRGRGLLGLLSMTDVSRVLEVQLGLRSRGPAPRARRRVSAPARAVESARGR
jgi:Zn-dependent protease/CBS domain-containing protein